MSDTLENKYYVYCHQRKDTGKCFYIGKGQRYRANSKDNRSRYWHNIVEKAKGFEVVILVNGISEVKALELEIYFINQIGRQNLCNLTDGGEGVSGYKHSSMAKAKIAKASKGNSHNIGKECSEKTRAKMSNTLKGKQLSEEHKANMRQPKSEEHKVNMRKPKSDEHKRKLREAWIKRRDNKPNQLSPMTIN